MRAVSSRTDTTTYTSTFRNKLAPEDQTTIYRLVGFYEYLNALQNLDALMRMMSPEELKVVDEMIKDRHEFAVFTNLSRLHQTTPSSLTETSQRGDTDHFERRGLAWVMALARVEVGAMLAGFTRVASPFEAVRPSQYEMAAYKELLLDGARTHYWSLGQEDTFRRVVARSLHAPGAETLAYVRRLTIARAFHDAATKSGWQSYSSDQQLELAQWQKHLDNLHKGLTNNVEAFLRRERVVQRKDVKVQDEMRIASVVCQAQLVREQYELNLGTAQVEYVDSLD